MRMTLITDTLVDINGVSRFIQNVAAQARTTGRDLEVLTCTRLPMIPGDNLVNIPPLFARKMPGYENLELAAPSQSAIREHLRRRRPDVIHISTPGPVGIAGHRAAQRLGIPMLGVYHTDFPAYIDHLFEQPALTWAASWFMRRFYQSFSYIFTRSEEYLESLVRLGMPRQRLLRLRPGIETAQFNTSFRDPGIWRKLEAEGFHGIAGDAVRVIYVGRVSVEKNLPLLTRLWRQVQRRLQDTQTDAQLIIVGDGPYRTQMQNELAADNAYFLGFRYGDELATLYAGSDLFVFPSLTDTLGQVVMEAQSCGVPVIVADEGGPKEVVEHGITGLVLDADNPRQWVEAMLELILAGDKRRSMAAAAAGYMAQYDISHSFEHFWSTHETAAAERQAVAAKAAEHQSSRAAN